MPILASEALLHENRRIQWQNFTQSENRTRASHNLWFQVQHSPFYTNLTFTCKTETLGSLYSHTLLIIPKSSKNKREGEKDGTFRIFQTGGTDCWVLGENLLFGNVFLKSLRLFEKFYLAIHTTRFQSSGGVICPTPLDADPPLDADSPWR